MAAKKQKPTKRPPKAKLTPIIAYHKSLADADAFYAEAWQLGVDGGVSLLMSDEKLVATLLANYRNTCFMLVEARRLLEDPNIAHAISTVKRLEALEAKLSDVESDLRQAKRDLDRHEATNDHQSNGNYYFE